MRRLLISTLIIIAAACSGRDGKPGERGARGPRGETGPEGPMGEMGERGAMGATGEKGEKGDPGDPGMMGLPGVPGEAGPPGATVVLSERAKLGFDIAERLGLTLDLANVSTDDYEAVGRGSYIVNALAACNDCHATQQGMGPPLYMAGGSAFELGGGGRVYARNLTPDPTTGMMLTEDQFMASMRTGEDFRYPGEQLIVMPWIGYRWMTDEDLLAIYAFLKTIPPVMNPVPDDLKGPLAALTPVPFPSTYDEGAVPRDLPPATAPDPDHVLRGLALQPLADPAGFDTWSVETQSLYGRGSYLVNAQMLCNDCHTNPARDFNPGPTFMDISTDVYLSGGTVFAVPPPLQPLTGHVRTMAANLTGDTNGYSASFTEFLKTLTQGIHADEPTPAPLGFPMPWQVYGNATLEDLQAVYVYITNVPRRTGAADKATQSAARYCTANSDCNTALAETCNLATSECVGRTCIVDADCDACQTCSAGASTCEAPALTADCLTLGI